MKGERYKNGLNYEESQALEREMAVRVYCMDLANVMISTSEAEPQAQKLAEAGGQQWLQLEARMCDALIALGDLGYKVVRTHIPYREQPALPHTRFRKHEKGLGLELSFDDGKTWRRATAEEFDELVEITPCTSGSE